MKKLVLTGLEQFWPEEDKEAVFLAPWCFTANSKRSFLEQKNFQIIESPWKDAQDISAAIKLTENLIDRVSIPLAQYLNQYQPTPRSVVFWQIYTTAWLVDWFDVFYDRYCWLSKANEQAAKEKKYTVDIPDGIKAFPHFLSDFDFPKLSLMHDFNAVIFSDLIQSGEFSNLSPQIAPLKVDIKQKSLPNASLRTSLFHSAALRITDLTSSSRVQFGNIYGLSALDKLFFALKLDPLFFLRKKADISLLQDRSLEHRAQLSRNPKLAFSFGAETPFEKIVEKLLLHYLPDHFFHVYGEEDPCEKWLGSDFYTSPVHAWRLALLKERNGTCYASQHGGGYGISFPFPLAKIEYEKSDRFLTWGWNEHGHHDKSKFYPLASPKLSRLNHWEKSNDQLIFPTASYAAYQCRLESGRLTNDILKYYEERLTFIRALPKHIQKSVLYKPAPNSYGVDEIHLLKDILDTNQFSKEGYLPKLLANAKLTVLDQLGTSFLEAFAINVPTVLIHTAPWDRFCDTATEDLLELEKVGILYRSVEKAANHIETIWAKSSEWWLQNNIQAARERFCNRFARKSPNWRTEWLQFLAQN